MSLPFTSLDAVTAPGLGVTRDYEDGVSTHTIIVTTTGNPSAFRVTLEGSHDGVNWADLYAEVENPPDNPSVATRTTGVVRFVRARLTSLTGGSSPTVTATVLSL